LSFLLATGCGRSSVFYGFNDAGNEPTADANDGGHAETDLDAGADEVDAYDAGSCTDITSVPDDFVCDGVDCTDHGRCYIRDGEPVCNCDPGYYNSGPTICEPDHSPGICNQEGWCWQNPRPQGNHLNAIWGTLRAIRGRSESSAP
jgi:hypothetical protein